MNNVNLFLQQLQSVRKFTYNNIQNTLNKFTYFNTITEIRTKFLDYNSLNSIETELLKDYLDASLAKYERRFFEDEKRYVLLAYQHALDLVQSLKRRFE